MTEALILSSLISGILNGIGSSGGMLFMSVMLVNGFHPVVATATNKVIALIGSIGAIKNYWKYSESVFKIKGLLLFSIFGSVIGAFIVLNLKEELLGKVYTALTGTLLLILFWLKKIKSYVKKNKGAKLGKYYIFVGTASGFYNGFFGPGTIIMTSIPLNLLGGYTEKTSLSTATIINTVTNAVACIILGSALFSIFELNIWLLVSFILANTLGQYCGSLFIVRVGEKYIGLISKITLVILLFVLIEKYWA